MRTARAEISYSIAFAVKMMTHGELTQKIIVVGFDIEDHRIIFGVIFPS